MVSLLVSVAASQWVPIHCRITLGPEGCSIGIATFANFGYAAKASGGTKQIPPNQFKVNPVDI